MATKEDPSTTIIIICNHHAQKIPKTHKDMHPILTILPNTLEYNPAPKWPQYLQQHENQYASTTKERPQETNN